MGIIRINGYYLRFQSTPPAEARGDVLDGLHGGSQSTGFNPLPPPKRGETSESTRARGERCLFQSTPPAEARGDSPDDVFLLSTRSGFNPLPPPKRGET